MAKAVDVLKRFGAVTAPVDRVNWISKHLLAFLVVGRGAQGLSNWMSQRILTPNLTEFERAAFKESRRVLFQVLYIMMTLDDDLFGTRADDNQVETLSTREADTEGHTADTIACAFSRVGFVLRFRRHGEGQAEFVKEL